MTKTSFTQASTVLPGFFLLEHHPDPKNDQSAKLHEGTFKKAQDFIADGMKPLVAFRKAFDVSCDDVAKAIVDKADHYRKIESGEIEMTSEDAFCLAVYFGVMPYHLISPDSKPMPFPVLQASLKLYDLLDDNSALKDDAYNTIMDEALPAASIEKMGLERDRMMKQPLTDLIITFIDMMLRGDNAALPKEEASANKLADDFLNLIRDEQKESQQQIEAINKQCLEAGKKFYRFGYALYRDIKNVEWKDIWSGLSAMRSIYENAALVNYYRTQPASIGLSKWPRDFVIADGFKGKWKDAHTVHVKMLDHYLKLDAMQDDAKAQLKFFNRCLPRFKKWKDNNGALLGQFANRQAVLNHPDFEHMRKRMTQGVKLLPSPRL